MNWTRFTAPTILALAISSAGCGEAEQAAAPNDAKAIQKKYIDRAESIKKDNMQPK